LVVPGQLWASVPGPVLSSVSEFCDMNKIAKPLVVFVAAGSLAFMAFAIALTAGGPDWDAISKSESFTRDFVLTVSTGEQTAYAVRHRRSDQQVSSSTVLAEVVVAALQRQAQDLQTQVQQIQQETERKVPLVPEIVRLKEQDEKALAARSDVLEQELTNLRTRESQMLAAQAEKSAETQSVMQVVVERRNEGFRMKNLLELLRTDAYVAQVQKKALDDELIRLKENVRRLEKRNQQLKQTISTTYDQDKVSSNP
jgi:hypothetical protein